MEHIKLLNADGFGSLTYSNKTLLSRATGTFYTPELIGRHLCEAVACSIALKAPRCIEAADPFCGDGRLISWLLEAASKHSSLKRADWRVTLWDCDDSAIRTARSSVARTAKRLGMAIKINASAGDSFRLALSRFGEFNVVVTNPPWEVLKPDRRELSALGKVRGRSYIQRLKERSAELIRDYAISKPKISFSGWGTNLARVGTEVALRMTGPLGVCGLVSPASLFADQTSEELRRWIIETHGIADLAYFPAEARLFDHVDQPCITAVLNKQSSGPTSTRLTFYDYGRGATVEPKFTIDATQLRDTGFVLPLQLGLGGVRLLERLRGFQQFVDLEGDLPNALWAGRELDETGYSRYLAAEGQYLFVKGRMIRRFGIAERPSRYVMSDGPRIPSTASAWRVAWRDVSRPTQKRRVHAAMIPPLWVSGNSLNLAYFKDHNLRRLKSLLAVMSSLVFEFQIRAYLATAHVSLGTVRKARVPDLFDSRTVNVLSGAAERCIADGSGAAIDCDTVSARVYGLGRNDFVRLVSCFDKFSSDEKDKLVMAY